MRFSTLSTLTLPLLAAATQQESPLEQAKSQAQYWFNKVYSKIPSPSIPHSPQAAAAKAGGKTLNILTIDNWEETLKTTVKAGSATPQEWWVLVTGGNKTCFGQCTVAEAAFNQTAAAWSLNPAAPNLAYLNCDNQPVLCNSWAAGTPSLYIFETAPRPALIDLHVVGLNTTTTTMKTFTDLHSTKSWKEKDPYTGYFHPFDGVLAQFGVAKPLGYFFWIFSVVPSWLFMIGISFASRTIMSRRMQPPVSRPAGAPAAAR